MAWQRQRGSEAFTLGHLPGCAYGYIMGVGAPVQLAGSWSCYATFSGSSFTVVQRPPVLVSVCGYLCHRWAWPEPHSIAGWPLTPVILRLRPGSVGD